MNGKKGAALIVVVGMATSAVTYAQDGSVRVYGRANLGLDNYSATGAAAGSAADYKARNRVYDAGSRVGFEGSEELGGGLKAIFLMETGVNIDNGSNTGQSGTTNSYTGFWSSRIGHAGLQGGWGRLTFGKSNVWWGNGSMEQTSVNYVATGVPVFYGLLADGMNVGVTRVNNLLQYSAQMGGYIFQASYSPNAEAVQGAGSTNGKLFGLSAQGQWGAFGAGYDWVKNRGNSPAAGSTPASTGHKARAAWQYQPGGQVSIIWVRSVQDNGGAASIAIPLPRATLQALGLDADAAATQVKQTSWGLNWEHAIGSWQAFAQWAKVNNITGCVTAGRCDNTNAKAWMLGGRYNFSKRTGAYVNYAAIRNDSKYGMDFVGGWMTSANVSAGLPGVPGLPAGSFGADPRIIGVGVMHNF